MSSETLLEKFEQVFQDKAPPLLDAEQKIDPASVDHAGHVRKESSQELHEAKLH
jgi:hypothetical protein